MGKLKHYLRLARFDRPIGTWLLLLPTLWGLWVAADGFPGWDWLSIFTLGVIATRAFGCVINDIADRDIDKHVWRTKNRPLANGDISLPQAYAVAAFFLLIAFALWLWALPLYAKIACVIALLLICIYPLTKRFFKAPQFVLGVVFGSGILVADMAINNALPSAQIIWLYIANFFWIVAYDTIYAMADKADDARYGKIHSTALLFGDNDYKIASYLYVATVLTLSFIGIYYHYGIAFQVALIGACLCLFQFWRLYKTRVPAACLAAFSANHWFGLVVLVGIIAAKS